MSATVYEIYRGYTIYELKAPSGTSYYIEGIGGYFASVALAEAAVDSYLANPGTAPPYVPPNDNPTDVFSPDLHNWVGYLIKADQERENKLVALGPAPPGTAGKIEGVLLLVLINRLSKTPEGLRSLREWGVQYLKSVGKIIEGISTSSAANVYNCIVNQYVAVRIYQRMGLISAHDAVQTCAWCDHVMGEMLKAGYFKESMGGLTTLVNATSETGLGGERSVGLASLARLFSRGAAP